MKYLYLFEKYLESGYSPLYHYTPYLEKIIYDDILKMNQPYKGDKCVCVTRSPLYKYDGIGSKRIKLDQNKLRLDGYVPKSIDEFGYQIRSLDRKYRVENDISPDNNTEWEYEERIYKNIKDVGKYIISIQLPNTQIHSIRNFIPIYKEYLKKYPDIKLEFYDIHKRWEITPVDLTKFVSFEPIYNLFRKLS